MADGDSMCAVCEQRLEKARFHYGGISCYSCRAFFRRNTQRDELPLCKGESRCAITAAVRKQCAACRYDKCLRIGMRPELVLDDDEKKTRFRKFLSKKQGDNDPDDGRASVMERNNSLSPSYDHENSGTPGPIRDRPSFHSPITHPEQAMRLADPSLPHAMRMADPSLPHNPLLYNTRMSPPIIQNSAITKVVAAKSTTCLYERPMTEVKTEVNIIQNCSTSYSQNTSMNTFDNYNYLFKKNTFHTFQGEQLPFQMYPDKTQQNALMGAQGENFRNWARFPQYLKTNQNHPSHPDPFYGNQVTYQPHHQQSNQVKALEMHGTKKEDLHCYPGTNTNYSDKNAKSVIRNKEESLPMTCSQPMKELNQISKSLSCEIPSTSSKTYETVLKPKEEEEDYDANGVSTNHSIWFKQFSGEELIQRYVNKKYGKDMFFNSQSSFLENFCSNQSDFQDSLSKVIKQGTKRKSVIVRAGANKNDGKDADGKGVETELEKLNDSYMSDVIDNALSLIPDASEMLKNFNFDIMQDLYTNEEHCHVERIVSVWQEKWDELSFGQDIVGTYIGFCHNRNEFPAQFFKLINLQIRERCLSFVCSLEEVDQICAEDQIYLFRRNLDNAEMMAYVHSFNQKTWAEELDFVLGTKDKMQWMVGFILTKPSPPYWVVSPQPRVSASVVRHSREETARFI
eukprot:GFUD01003877.1.p1 GENE.GFUD01003877.1~~GFUD01003877.1.p1  ORF type:complete len:682 (+),score=79.52 GFUD01003877.1:382-2427(+)